MNITQSTGDNGAVKSIVKLICSGLLALSQNCVEVNEFFILYRSLIIKKIYIYFGLVQ